MAAQNKDDIRKKWNKIATWYSSVISEILTIAGLQLVLCAPLESSKKVIEIGCADGRLAQIVTTMFPDVDYTGIDISDAMIDLAKTRVPASAFSVGDCENLLSFPANYFDRYLCSMVLHHTDASKTLDECFRILKPGGTAAFCIWGTRERCTFWTLVDEVCQEVLETTRKYDSYRLSDNDYAELKELVNTSKFPSYHMWHQDISMPFSTGEHLGKYFGEFLHGFLDEGSLTPDKVSQAVESITQRANEIIASHKPLVFAVSYIVLVKPP